MRCLAFRKRLKLLLFKKEKNMANMINRNR